MFKAFILPLSPRARLGLAAGALAIGVGILGLAVWIMRGEEQVLFSDLRPQDAALMVAELDRLKVPYRIGANGTALFVDAGIVHATRLKLMGKEMPLHGAAGFELFNSGDFGMTEFAQKVNYQRALQGEITRTILSLAEVREARVHLVLPEEGLFRRSQAKPKAAITLGLRTGEVLRPEQVGGIQRLVAAAVPGIAWQDVTIVDQKGVALTRASTPEAEGEGATGRLDLKRETEKLLTRKATEVLERAFGTGQAVATVDVTLNMDQVKVTTEDVISVPSPAGTSPSGVIVREKETTREAVAAAEGTARSPVVQREVDYQVGRRVEQVTTQPGAVRRIHVAAMILHPVEPQQLEHVRALVTAAVGGVPDRGDTIVVQSRADFKLTTERPTSREPAVAPAKAPTPEPGLAPVGAWGAGLAFAAVGAGALALRRSRKAVGSGRQLSDDERQALLARMRQWLDAEDKS